MKLKNVVINYYRRCVNFFLYEDIERVIKDIITTKIKREHLTNYLKHSFKIYKK